MERSQAEDGLVLLRERFTNSPAFGVLFREGMDLVEETAAYLEAPAEPMPRRSIARQASPMRPRACA